MKLIAHRGYKTKYIKENTIEAFTNAINNDFIGIEADVRVTKDGKLVVCHDAFIDRVSDGSGLLSNYTYQELLNYNFGSREVPSRIPLLSEVLNSFDCIKLIEIKTRIDLNKIIPLVDDNTYFISFDSSYIFKLKKKYPRLKFGVLNYVLNSKNNYNLDIICLLDGIVTNNLVNHFNSLDIKVFTYGIKDKPTYINDNIYYIVNDKI